jgi:hypothetical protein
MKDTHAGIVVPHSQMVRKVIGPYNSDPCNTLNINRIKNFASFTGVSRIDFSLKFFVKMSDILPVVQGRTVCPGITACEKILIGIMS